VASCNDTGYNRDRELRAIAEGVKRIANALESKPGVIVINADALGDPESVKEMIQEFLRA
jgi:hypothetical protein